MRLPFVVLFFLLGGLTLACVTLTGAGQAVEQPVMATEIAGSATPMTIAPASTPVTPAPTPTLVATETRVVPTPRRQLTATDPRTVQLDDGQLKLVEFFAFW